MATAALRDPRRAWLALGAAAAIWASVLAIVTRLPDPRVQIAAAFDLTITCTAAVWWLAVRRGHLPRWVLTIVAIGGAIAARMLLARAHASIAAGALLELCVLALVVARGGRVLGVLATEARVLGWAIAGWRAPRGDFFTVHRANGWAWYAGVFVALSVVETPIVHVVLLAAGHPTAAWIATALSLYGIAWLVGDLHALRHGGVRVTGDAIEVTIGVRWRARIAAATIAKIERGGATADTADVSILGANVVVTLTEPCTLVGLLGRRKTARAIALSIDDPDRFLRSVAPLVR